MSTIEKENNVLAKKFTMGSLMRFALPTILMMEFIGLYQVIDAMFISNYVSTDGLSAINIVSPAIALLWGLGSMFATGGSALIAQKMGKGKEREAKQNFSAIVLVASFLGLVISIIGTIFLDTLIFALGGSERLLPYARQYLGITLLFSPAILLQVLFQNLFVTAGKPKLGLMVMVLAGLTNLVLDYCFIVILHMGMAGAAIATAVGYCISTVTGLVLFAKPKGTLHFVLPKIKPKEWWLCCYNGCSEMVGQISLGITILIFNIVMMRLAGENGVAALSLLLYTQYVFGALFTGFSMAVSPVFSYQYGAKNTGELRRLLKICLLLMTFISVLLFLICQTSAGAIAGFFVPKDSYVFHMAVDGCKIYAFVYLFSGFGIFTSALLTALSNGKLSAILSFTRTFALFSLFLLIFPRFWGVTGAWLAPPSAEFLSMLLAISFLLLCANRYFGGRLKTSL